MLLRVKICDLKLRPGLFCRLITDLIALRLLFGAIVLGLSTLARMHDVPMLVQLVDVEGSCFAEVTEIGRLGSLISRLASITKTHIAFLKVTPPADKEVAKCAPPLIPA